MSASASAELWACADAFFRSGAFRTSRRRTTARRCRRGRPSRPGLRRHDGRDRLPERRGPPAHRARLGRADRRRPARRDRGRLRADAALAPTAACGGRARRRVRAAADRPATGFRCCARAPRWPTRARCGDHAPPCRSPAGERPPVSLPALIGGQARVCLHLSGERRLRGPRSAPAAGPLTVPGGALGAAPGPSVFFYLAATFPTRPNPAGALRPAPAGRGLRPRRARTAAGGAAPERPPPARPPAPPLRGARPRPAGGASRRHRHDRGLPRRRPAASAAPASFRADAECASACGPRVARRLPVPFSLAEAQTLLAESARSPDLLARAQDLAAASRAGRAASTPSRPPAAPSPPKIGTPMRILLVHQNFPGQYKHIAEALGRDPAHEVVALGVHHRPCRQAYGWCATRCSARPRRCTRSRTISRADGLRRGLRPRRDGPQGGRVRARHHLRPSGWGETPLPQGRLAGRQDAQFSGVLLPGGQRGLQF